MVRVSEANPPPEWGLGCPFSVDVALDKSFHFGKVKGLMENLYEVLNRLHVEIAC